MFVFTILVAFGVPGIDDPLPYAFEVNISADTFYYILNTNDFGSLSIDFSHE